MIHNATKYISSGQKHHSIIKEGTCYAQTSETLGLADADSHVD